MSGAAATAALAQSPVRLLSQAAAGLAEITLSADFSKLLATMPYDFTGLSYESAQLGHPDFFSGSNHGLIALFRCLSPRGVLRIGGNTAEYATWSDNDADAAKNDTPHAIGPDAGTAAKTASILTPIAIRNLKDFITQAGDWRVIYGLNLWHGTPKMPRPRRHYVFKTLGDRASSVSRSAMSRTWITLRARRIAGPSSTIGSVGQSSATPSRRPFPARGLPALTLRSARSAAIPKDSQGSAQNIVGHAQKSADRQIA